MNSSALQIPSDPDATYRNKAGNFIVDMQLILKKQLEKMVLL